MPPPANPEQDPADGGLHAPAISEELGALLPVGEPMSIENISDSLVIRERSVFLLTDPDGNVLSGNSQGFGVYHADTRHLSTYAFSLNGLAPLVLLSTAELGYAMEQVLTNPTLAADDGRVIERGRFLIRRQRTIADVLEERLTVTNFGTHAVTLHVRYDFAADFADIFDVRGYTRRRHGTLHDPVVGQRDVLFSYSGVDGRERRTRVVFERIPDRLAAHSALFRFALEPGERQVARLSVFIDQLRPEMVRVNRFTSVGADHREWRESTTQIVADNELFNTVMNRSLNDVRMLLSETEDGDRYFAAGTPWFDALFGRDSCILALQMLAFRPDIARATLLLLAKMQGTRLTPSRDEEPGKILHELRFDELSRANELPYGPYFGSVDSTPLFLVLLAEYCAWTGDLRLARDLLPAVRLALEWMEVYGDPTSSGFLTYEKRSAKGLVNQGWKDSWDAVVHEDGTLARAPIALAEVQGYAYAAKRRLAPILEQIGEGELAGTLRQSAEDLRTRFNESFWVPRRSYYAMAFDGAGQQVSSIASNPAHCLWAGIVDPARAADVAAHLLSAEMFTGWGIRTLEARNPRFNPIGYHTGTVWPHDNSIAALGLKIYGAEDQLNAVASALFDAAGAFPYFRLPELFGGDARSEHRSPVPYPVACRPQSWAAGAMPLVTQAILGLKAEAQERRLRIVNPRLPQWLNSVQVRGLRVGSGTVTLQFRRSGRSTSVEVQRTTGNVDVVVSRRWPLD